MALLTRAAATEEDQATGEKQVGVGTPLFGKGAAEEVEEEEEAIVLGAAFVEDQYPGNTDEFVLAYQKWNAAQNIEISPNDARRDIQAFMSQEPLMEKWRPILQAAADEANKKTPIDYINDFTALALPLAVGFTLLPLLRQAGEQVPVLKDVVIPNIDKGIDLVKGGAKKAIELPICLEFGDC